jgi:DNA-binding NarL/FixJ family response regulator
MKILTQTEGSIVELLADGFTAPDIAKVRGTSVHTVRTQIETMRNKCGAHSTTQLVAKYLRGEVGVQG